MEKQDDSGRVKQFDMEFLEETLQYNWDMQPVDRSFDPIKVKAYLDLIPEPYKSVISQLLINTKYIPYHEFKQSLLQSFDIFRDKIGNTELLLFVDTNKIGSEHWVTALLWPQLREFNITRIIDQDSAIELDSVNNVLIIDDAIYSGVNVLSYIDMLTYHIAEKAGVQQNEIGGYFHFHLIVPYVSIEGEEEVASFCRSMNIGLSIYSVYHLNGLETLMNINSEIEANLYPLFGIEWSNAPAVYFDHKVAGAQSTYPTIYLEGRLPDGSQFGPLLKSLPSRYKIEELEQLYKNYLRLQ